MMPAMLKRGKWKFKVYAKRKQDKTMVNKTGNIQRNVIILTLHPIRKEQKKNQQS